jgi:hypothetical protein
MAYTVIGGKLVNSKKVKQIIRNTERQVQVKAASADKGVFQRNCNRTACQRPGATWYNTSTRAYYCPACGNMLSNENAIDALVWSGHDLCIPVDAEVEGYKLEGDMLEKAQQALATRLHRQFGKHAVGLLETHALKFESESERTNIMSCVERIRKLQEAEVIDG